MNKKINTFIILLITIFAVAWVNAEDDCNAYSDSTGYLLYEERVRCLCDKYKPEKSVVVIEDKFKNIDKKENKKYNLSKFKNIHSENMNLIYRCWILFAQKKWYELIKNELIKDNKKLKNKLDNKIKNKISILESKIWIFWCKESNENDSIMKLKILKQTTYETCKYVNYLEYLKERNNKIENILDEDKYKYTINEIFVAESKKNNEINEEINHVFKVFPIAYHAYSEYENNISIHFLLELLKEDFIIFRDLLHSVLNPINQVVYKISNAMRSQ